MQYNWIDEFLLRKAGVSKDLQAEWNWIRYKIEEESYNLLKILAIFMVLASHMMNVVELVPPEDMHALQLHNAVRAFLLTSNGLFFMLSGRFLLSQFDGKILDFYCKRKV